MQPASRAVISGDTALAHPEVRLAPAPSAGVATCSDCGHGRQAHQHYRRGTDCALCGCDRFRRSLLARLLGTR
ncbi:hypothetical protein [Geodermatophilus amargosae]|uniref:hypothetical protein n=1 Tax=Geodermatophilus amargosae TaxID=1296565 RepID=UPI0034DED817